MRPGSLPPAARWLHSEAPAQHRAQNAPPARPALVPGAAGAAPLLRANGPIHLAPATRLSVLPACGLLSLPVIAYPSAKQPAHQCGHGNGYPVQFQVQFTLQPARMKARHLAHRTLPGPSEPWVQTGHSAGCRTTHPTRSPHLEAVPQRASRRAPFLHCEFNSRFISPAGNRLMDLRNQPIDAGFDRSQFEFDGRESTKCVKTTCHFSGSA